MVRPKYFTVSDASIGMSSNETGDLNFNSYLVSLQRKQSATDRFCNF
jgi:hypothetical protein